MSVVLGEQAAFLMDPQGVGAGPTIPLHAEGSAARAPDDAPMTTPPSRRGRGLRLRHALVLALLALPLVALLSHPWWLAGRLSSYLSETSGREVRFDKVRLGFGDSLAPQATFEGVRIANAPWGDASRPFAVLRQAVFQFAWHRYEGRWLVTRMILSDGEVHLHRQADGRRNWRLRDPEDRGPGHFWFRALEPHRIGLSFVHDAAELELRSRASDLAAEPSQASTDDGRALVNRIDFDGRWRGMPFAGRADSGREITFFESGRWFPLRGQAGFAGIRLEADGRAADLFRGLKVDAATTVSGKSLAGLRPLIGPRPAEPRAFRAEGRLVIDEAVYAIKAARAKVGGTDLAGDVTWARRDERPSVSARLTSDATDLADLLWLAGKGASASAAPSSAAASASSPPRDAFARAREVDADIAFQAKRLRVAAVPLLQSLRVRSRLADGRLAFSDLDIGWAGGHSTGTIGLDLRAQPPRSEAQLETRGVRLETLFPTNDASHRVTGILRGKSALKAVGDDAQALRASLSGSVSAQVSAGTIPSLLDAQMSLAVGKMLKSFIGGGNEPLVLPCAAVRAELGGGLARIRSLVVDSANTRTTGSGVVDLRDGSIDMMLTPEPKRPGLLELRKSIHLSGKPPNLDKSLVERLEPLKATDCDAVKP